MCSLPPVGSALHTGSQWNSAWSISAGLAFRWHPPAGTQARNEGRGGGIGESRQRRGNALLWRRRPLGGGWLVYALAKKQDEAEGKVPRRRTSPPRLRWKTLPCVRVEGQLHACSPGEGAPYATPNKPPRLPQSQRTWPHFRAWSLWHTRPNTLLMTSACKDPPLQHHKKHAAAEKVDPIASPRRHQKKAGGCSQRDLSFYHICSFSFVLFVCWVFFYYYYYSAEQKHDISPTPSSSRNTCVWSGGSREGVCTSDATPLRVYRLCSQARHWPPPEIEPLGISPCWVDRLSLCVGINQSRVSSSGTTWRVGVNNKPAEITRASRRVKE